MTFLKLKVAIISFIVVVLLISSGIAFAQVGFNNPNPDASSILDLTTIDKGLLIPRLTKPQREAIASPGRSLLVFDTSDGKFYFYDGGQWYALNEWVKNANTSHVSSTGNVIINGNASITGSSSTAGNISGGSINIPGFPTNALIPAGVIVMWSGSINPADPNYIPSGWALCNGLNGTPNLTDRFIVGAGASYNPKDFGGQNTVTLTTNQLPTHTHTATTGTDGAHSHMINGEIMQKDGSSTKLVAALDTNGDAKIGDYNKPTAFDGTHSHAVTVGSTGLGQAFDIRPLYFSLAYIMKLP